MSTTRQSRVRLWSGIAVVGAASLVLAACGSSSSGGGSSSPSGSSSSSSTLPKTLVFSPIGLQVPAMKGLSEGVKGYAGSQGWTVTVQDPSLDPAKQVQQVQQVLESGQAGALWIIAIAPASMSGVLKTAQSKGVPVLINGVPADYGLSGPQKGITFDTIDYAAGGKAVGENLGKCIVEKLGGNAQVIVGTSAPGTAGKKEYDDAVLASLKAAAPNAQVVQDWTISDRAKSQTDVGAILQGKPDVNAVAAANDEGALGAIGAFKAAGKDLPCITEFGGNDEVLADVKKGIIYASAALQFADDMKQSVDTLGEMQKDPTQEGKLLTVPLKVFTASS